MQSSRSHTEAIRSSISKTNELFSQELAGKHNFEVLDRIYTADARILPPGAPVVSGRENIGKFMSDFLRTANVVSAVPATEDLIVIGDGVVETGITTVVLKPEGQAPVQMSVKYVVLWRLEDGDWKVQVDIWNDVG